MREARLDTLLERVNDVDLLTRGDEHEWDARVLQHVQDLVKHDLLARFNVGVDVFQDKEDAQVFLVALEQFLHLSDQLDSLVLVGHLLQIECLAKLEEYFLL